MASNTAFKKAKSVHGSVEASEEVELPKSVYDKITDGDYLNKLPFPQRPHPPVSVDDYKKALLEYRNESSRLVEEFKADALAEVGLTGHPKADKVYFLAREHGHSAGLHEVMNYLVDFADLVK